MGERRGFQKMLDMNFIRENPDKVRWMLEARGMEVDLEGLLEWDRKFREATTEVNELRHRRNVLAETIPRAEDPQEKRKLIEESREVNRRIKELEGVRREALRKREEIRLLLPNMPRPGVPVGEDESDNKVIRSWGERPTFSFPVRSHQEIGEELDIIDFTRGSRMSGTGFYVLKGDGARLERALINFMLDLHKQQGYAEIFPPILVRPEAMVGTGQLPKFQEDMYWCERDDLYLIPTAEVPVTNLHMNEILSAEDLPLYYTAYTPCFRREAGRHLYEKGVIRVHQFNKVELVKFTLPEDSDEELEKLTADAEEVLKRLELHFRTVQLCTGDLGFSSANTYDLEVWMPSFETYVEVSSCSTFTDFQARRAKIRFKRKAHLESEFVHTLNGSGVAIGRTMAAILENYQLEDGRVEIPKVLRPYMKGQEVIERPERRLTLFKA